MLMHFLDIFLINRKQNTKKVILTMLERFIIEYENGMIDINEESYKDEWKNENDSNIIKEENQETSLINTNGMKINKDIPPINISNNKFACIRVVVDKKRENWFGWKRSYKYSRF